MVVVKKNLVFFFIKVSKYCMCYVELILVLSFYLKKCLYVYFYKIIRVNKKDN